MLTAVPVLYEHDVRSRLLACGLGHLGAKRDLRYFLLAPTSYEATEGFGGAGGHAEYPEAAFGKH